MFRFNRLLILALLLIFSFEPIVVRSSGEYFESTLEGNWPAPGTRYQSNRNRRHRQRVLTQSTSTSGSTTNNHSFAAYLNEIWQNCFLFTFKRTASTLPTQRECEICMEMVDFIDFHRCCVNGHHLHSQCFATILSSPTPALRKCPMCRVPLYNDPRHLQSTITPFVSVPIAVGDDTWEVLESHLKILRQIKPDEVNNLNWNLTFYHFVTKGQTKDLQRFLQLDLIDVNVSFFQISDGLCAVAVLLKTLYTCRLQAQRTERLLANLQILFEHPNIILNRLDGNIKAPKHLIYHAIEANNFDAFLRILEASPDFDRAELFRRVCSIPHREIFFNYLLTCKSFDLFALDTTSHSALHLAIRHGQTACALSLLELPEVTTNFLLQINPQLGSNYIHYGMMYADSSVVEKMLSFPDIDWDTKDASGTSIHNHYLNRMQLQHQT